MLHQRSFEERRIRSRSADPSKRRKTDIFFSADQKADDLKIEVSEYTKTFAWPKNQLDNVNEENINKRLNPLQKTHAAGLSSKQHAASNKAHVIQNSNGSTSIVIEPSIVNYAVAFPTGSATNLATMINTITHEPIRPLTSMALTDSADLNKSLSSNGSGQTKFNKSATITNLNDYTKQSTINHKSIKEEESIINEPLNDKSFKKSSLKDANNNTANVITNGGNFDEELLLKKLSKLNTYESIYGKKAGANCLFNKEEVIDARTIDKIPKQSEYKSKFKPFNTYVYVTGKGWFKPKKVKAKENYIIDNNVDDTVEKIIDSKISKPISIKSQETSIKITNDDVKTVQSKTNDSIKLVDEVDALVEEKAQPWYKEAEERRLKANEFRYKNIFGNPIYSANLEEVYKKASNNFWHASKAPKFEQLQQMRVLNSAFLPYDQHKKKMQDSALTSQQKSETDSKAPVSAVKATPSKSPRTKRATSVPPSKKSITTTPTNTTATKSQSNKVWLKPKSKTEAAQKDDSSAKETSTNKVQRPQQQQQNNLNKELKSAQEDKTVNGRKSPPIITANPVRTTQIRTPDALGELVGVKSPPPQDWIDKLDNEPLNWTNSKTNPPSLNSNTTYLMNEFNPSSIRSDNLADLSGLKI